MHRLLFVFLSMVSLGFAMACRSTSAPPAADRGHQRTRGPVVDGREIKRADVDKAYQRSGNAAQGMAEEEILAAKLGRARRPHPAGHPHREGRPAESRSRRQRAHKAFDDAKKNIPDEAFQQELTKRGVTAAEMREGLRRELLAQKVIEHDVRAKITVTAEEVSNFFLANRNQFNLPEEAYHLAQIVVTPVRDPQVANRTGDDAATPQAAAEKVKMLMERLKAGGNFAELAMGYSEDPETAPRGGDLGLVPMSTAEAGASAAACRRVEERARHGERREHGRRAHARACRGARAGGAAGPVDTRRERTNHRSAGRARNSCCARPISPPRATTRTSSTTSPGASSRGKGNCRGPQPRSHLPRHRQRKK